VASTATAVNRWIVAFRELARRDAAAEPAQVSAPAQAAVPAQAPPHYAPIPAKLRESAELGL